MKRILLLFFVLVCNPAQSDEIYKWVDNTGKVYYAEKKPKNQKVQQTAISKELRDTRPEIRRSETAIVKKSVVLYSTDSCASCKKARQYFISKAIPFREMNIEASREARDEFKNLGAKSVPFIRVGNQSMEEFSRKQFESLYATQEKAQ